MLRILPFVVLASFVPSVVRAAPPDAAPLPAFVSQKRRMNDTDLAKKKEGFFVTGLPFFSSDPLNGVGGGATGYLHFNGKRTDRLFAYAPYRVRLGVTAQYTTGAAGAIGLKLDAPYLANTGWRLKVDGKYENTPNNLYFGLTETTLGRLAREKYSDYADDLNRVRPGRAGEAARVSDALRNKFLEREWMINPKIERSFGSLRVLAGYEIQHLAYRTFEGQQVDGTDPATGQSARVPAGKSLLREDAEAGRAFGLQGGRVSLVQLSVMYDTRDYEPDPSRGVFLEWGTEHSSKVTGSEFTFTKMLFQARYFVRLAPSLLKRTVLATRLGYGTVLGKEAPFFEFQDQWSAEGSIRALGGNQTLRGYKANRFLGRTVAFLNAELRHRVADFDVLRQNITLTIAPFLDLGTVGDREFLIKPTARISGGAGLRIGWNRSTIIVLDGAASREDRQFFLTFNNSY